MIISAEGNLDFQADVASTLTWLAASIRYSETKDLSESRSSIIFQYVGNEPVFAIKSLPLAEVVQKESCWHQLFTYSVVAVNYPIAARKKGLGLEINYELMTILARAKLVAERDHGFIVRGLQFILVPTKLLDHGEDDCNGMQAVQWHVISTSGEKQTTFVAADSSKKPITPSCLKCRSREEFTQITSRRAFLGFWSKIKINIGTEDQDYPNPAGTELKSTAREGGRPIGFSALGSNVGGDAHGVSGAFNASVAIGERNVAAQLSLSTSVLSNLETRKSENLVLYDTETRRAWMLPFPSVLLHLVRLREKLFEPREPDIKLPFAEIIHDNETEASNACESAYRAIKPLISMLKENTANPKTKPESQPFQQIERLIKIAEVLQDHLEQLFIWLDQAQENQLKSRNKAMDFTHKKIYGIEFKEVARGQFRYKEQRLHHTSGGWSALRRDSGVIFCGNIGNAISPMLSEDQQLCSKWTELPRRKDYLVAPLRCLQTSNEAQSCDLPRSLDESERSSRDSFFTVETGDRKKEWEVTSTYFLPCENSSDESHPKICQKTARMRTRRRTLGSHAIFTDLRQHMEGAVIFGKPDRSLRVKLFLKSSKGTVAKLLEKTGLGKTMPIEKKGSCTPVRISNGSREIALGSRLDMISSAQGNVISIPGSPKQPERADLETLMSIRTKDEIPSTASGDIPGKSSGDMGPHSISSMTSDGEDSGYTAGNGKAIKREFQTKNIGVWTNMINPARRRSTIN